jgi:hypothetical protein
MWCWRLKLILFGVLLSLGMNLQAQVGPDLSFLITQDTLTNPTIIPTPFFLAPSFQLGLNRSQVRYVLPIRATEMGFSGQSLDAQWIQYSRIRQEYGLGLANKLAEGLRLGVSAYRGALNSYVQVKSERDERLPLLAVPFKLSQLEQWRVGDYGSFQTYGGIQLKLGYGLNMLMGIAQASATIQNQFILEVRKFSVDEILLSLTEEKLSKRKLILGPLPVNVAGAHFQGARLSASFRLKCGDPQHEELFALALAGELEELQRSLPATAQEIRWQGVESTRYLGVPWLAGRTVVKGRYEIISDEDEQELQVRESRNRGLLRLRNHQQVILGNEDELQLIWFSEMKQVNARALDKHFLGIGKVMGVGGFDAAPPAAEIRGSTISQLAISLGRGEAELFSDELSIQSHLEQRCEELALPCADQGRRRRLMRQLKKITDISWEQGRRKLGELLLKEPALMYALVRSGQLKKRAYFKFLSENFQSLEGWAPVAP